MTGYSADECAHDEQCEAEQCEAASIYGFTEYHQCQLERHHEEAHVCHCGVAW